MEETYKDETLVKSEVVGFYHGKPNKDDTEYYKYGRTVAYYE